MINKSELLHEMEQLVLSQMNYAEQLIQKEEQILTHRPQENSWNALECIEHLNLYAQFYIPEIKKRLSAAKRSDKTTFQPGWLGDKMVKSCMPDAKSKMKTFKAMNTLNVKVSKQVLADFIAHQKEFLQLLKEAQMVDLSKVKTSISISSLIKLRLGDVFRFVVYHQERHRLQAERAIKSKLNE